MIILGDIGNTVTKICLVKNNKIPVVAPLGLDKKNQTHNNKLCNVRLAFDRYNLISGLHTYLSKKDKSFQNLLPPLSLLKENDKKKLLEELKKLDFN